MLRTSSLWPVFAGLVFALAQGAAPVAAESAGVQAQPVVQAQIGATGETQDDLLADRRGEPLGVSPGDVLQLRVGAWNMIEGRYEAWAGVDGEITVQPDGSIMVPYAGHIAALGRTPASIAEEVAAALHATTGAGYVPAVAIEIAERRPIYVSGDVMAPGAFEFRDGLTARQALALAGGPVRAGGASANQLAGQRTSLVEARLRADLRIARLEAELDGLPDFDLPRGAERRPGLSRLIATERRLMTARQDSLANQIASVDALIEVLGRVRDGLSSQLALIQDDINRAEEELGRRRALAERGLVRASDLASAESSVSNLQLREVDMTNQLLGLEKDLSEAKRTRDALPQSREIEVLSELAAMRDRHRDIELEIARLDAELGMVGQTEGDITWRTELVPFGAEMPVDVEPWTFLRPGDTLILTAESVEPGSN